MQRRIWVTLFSVLATSLCAFGNGGDPSTIWTIASQPNEAGTYSYAGGTADLSGTGIAVESVFGQATTLNADSSTIVDGLLSFTSGAGTAGTWTWAGGVPGTLTITGCIQDPTKAPGTCIASESTLGTNTVLVEDEFTSVEITNYGGGTGLVFGGLAGSLDPTVAAYFGIPAGFVSLAPTERNNNNLSGLPATTGAAFGGTISTPNLYGPTVTSEGGVFTLVSTPEDWTLSSSLGIFVFGLAAFGVARRLGLIKAVGL